MSNPLSGINLFAAHTLISGPGSTGLCMPIVVVAPEVFALIPTYMAIFGLSLTLIFALIAPQQLLPGPELANAPIIQILWSGKFTKLIVNSTRIYRLALWRVAIAHDIIDNHKLFYLFTPEKPI